MATKEKELEPITLPEGVDKFQYIKDTWGWVPHDTQREFMSYDAKIKVASCGRRWGKTEACAYDLAFYALKNQGSKQFIISPTYDQSKIIFGLLETIFSASHLDNLKVTRAPYSKLNIGTSEIQARSADGTGANIRGHSADRIVVDEAAYVSDSVIYEVISPMLADKNGELILISTPFGKNHFFRFYEQGIEKNEEIASFSFPTILNPHISTEYVLKQKKTLSEVRYKTEYEAKFVDNVSNVFKYSEIQNAFHNILEIQKPSKVVLGIDFARYSDYSVCSVVECDGEKHKLSYLDRFNSMTWEEEINRICQSIEIYKPDLIICDGTGIGDVLVENLEKALSLKGDFPPIMKYVFTNQGKENIMNNLNMLLSSELLQIPENEVLISELENFEYKMTETGALKMNARYGFHDDTVCSLALALWGAKEFSYSLNNNVYAF